MQYEPPETSPRKVDLSEVRVQLDNLANLIYIGDYTLDIEDVRLVGAFIDEVLPEMEAYVLEDQRTNSDVQLEIPLWPAHIG